MTSHELFLKVHEIFDAVEDRLTSCEKSIEKLVGKVEGNTIRRIVENEHREISKILRVRTAELRDLMIEYHNDDDRPSQSQVIVNNVIEPPRKSSTPFGSARMRRAIIIVAIAVAGTTVGLAWGLRLLHVIQ